MKYSHLLALLKSNLNDPNAWIRVDDDTDGWNTSFLKEEVLLCIAFSVVFVQGKPVMRYDFKYGTTVFSRADFPMPPASALPTVVAMLGMVRNHVAGL